MDDINEVIRINRERIRKYKEGLEHDLTPDEIAILDREENGRSCGECTACCTTHGVAELKKTLFTKCQHVCKSGCAIYSQRPQSCRDFMCSWRSPMWADMWHLTNNCRPDKLGLVFGMCELSGGYLIEAHEVWKDARHGRRADTILHRVTQGFLYPIRIFLYRQKGKCEIHCIDPGTRLEVLRMLEADAPKTWEEFAEQNGYTWGGHEATQEGTA
jgi:hypothetical protein